MDTPKLRAAYVELRAAIERETNAQKHLNYCTSEVRRLHEKLADAVQDAYQGGTTATGPIDVYDLSML